LRVRRHTLATMGVASEEREDQVLSLIGNFGRWQFILCLIIALPGVVTAWQILVIKNNF
jgi:hypothetical protein